MYLNVGAQAFYAAKLQLKLRADYLIEKFKKTYEMTSEH